MDTEIFKQIGLTASETRVYLSLLELEMANAGKILDRSKLQNSVLHRSLNSLAEKGLVSFIWHGKRKIYNATPPENMLDILEERKNRFKQALPELKSIRNSASSAATAGIYKGKKGINEMYNLLLNSGGKEYNTFGGGERVTHSIMGDTWWKNLHARRIEKKIKSRQCFDESIRKFGQGLNRLPLTNIRFLTREFEQLQETVIIGDCIGIAIFTETPYGILIKDISVADGYRLQFELLWKTAKE